MTKEIQDLAELVLTPAPDVKVWSETGNMKTLHDSHHDLVVCGVDTGVKTGISFWNITQQKFLLIQTVTIDQAFNLVKFQQPALVRYEDARLRKSFVAADARMGRSGAGIREGVGSVKRDAKAWEDFLKNNEIPGEPVAPKNNTTKLSSGEFKIRTGWLAQTSEHARDAGMLVHGFTERNLRNTFKVLGISQAAEAGR